MASFLPLMLVGDNLGQRHRHLNSVVREAKEIGAPVQDVEALPEKSAVDRLFKIELAIQLKHVEYIIRNLKDDDMLYVSRALKATWLIDHRDIINPKYLEDVLFPEMIMPAVTKMKHWLYINLRDPEMCQEFYQRYKENTFEFAIKFLSHCSHEFILAEAPKILTKLSTHSLKVLCEKCPGVAKIYFDSFATDVDVKTRYLRQDRSFYNSVKCVLKSDADVFLDITEKYFNMNSFSRFSPLATDYILRNHKTRFINKLELYVAYFLHIPTLAARLSVEECQEVVVKIARASYLQHWFQYKVVEPLIKRLSPDKRAAFKKRGFVDKDVGDCEDKWPYEIPAPPVHSEIGPHIFDDQDYMSSIPPIYLPGAPCGGMLFGASASLCAAQPQALNYTHMNMIRMKTDLDRLFDEFRFIGFERALHELGQRLVATPSPERRRDIFLVLVSKTGGRTDAVSALLRLTARHINEPPHTRAAIFRSLVKRAKVWRMPADLWQHLLDYGHGLGLDGTPAEAACREGLHAVVIRQLLAGECEQAVRDAFMKDFSTLVEYSLKVDERKRVANGLQHMLAAATIDVEPAVAADRLRQLLDVLKIYRVRVEPSSPVVRAVMALAARDADVARPLLERLYNERIARRELLRLNMEFRRDEAALLNALRHDPSLLEPQRLADTLAVWNCWERNFNSFPSRPKVFGRKEPMHFGLSAAPTIGFTVGRPVIPSTGYTFGISTVPGNVPPTDVGISTTQSTAADSSAAPATGFRFGIPTTPPTDVGSFSLPPTDVGSSVALPTGFSFGSSAPQSTDFGSSAATPAGFSFGSSAPQPTDFGSSVASPTGLIFGSSAPHPTNFGSSASPPTNVISAAAPLTGFRFGIPTTPPIDVGSFSLPPTDVSSSVAPPTGFSFGSPAPQPTNFGSSAAPPTGFSFGSSAPQPTDFGSSVASPTGFSFGSSTAQPTDVGSYVALPTSFSFSSSAAQPTADSNSPAQPIDSCTLTDKPLVFGTPIDQSMVKSNSTDQPTLCGNFADLPTLFGNSADQLTLFGTSAPQPMGFGSSIPQPMGLSSLAAQPMVMGNAGPQPMGFQRIPYRPMGFRRFGARLTNFDRFTSKIVIYFDQKQDLTTHLRTALKKKITQRQNVRMARPLASLFGNNFEQELHDFDAAGKESAKFAAALRACAHRARPVVNLVQWGWRKAGVKAVATQAMRCREIERDALILALAAELRTVRVALALSMRSTNRLLLETFAFTAKLRPAVALRIALPYFRRHGLSSDLIVWHIVKPLISSIKLEPRQRLRNLLGNTDWIPSTIKPDYCVTLYLALYQISFYNAQNVLRDLSKLLPECDESIEIILLQMLDDDADKDITSIPYPTIFVRYLLLSRDEEDVNRRFMKIGNRFLERLDTLRLENDYHFQRRLNQILESLKYNSAFLDAKFPSCLAVIKKFLAWTQKFMPKDKYFEKYTQVRLTMLYFKAVRQSMKQMPEVFADPKRRKSEGVEAVGFAFGRYIVKEVAELVNTYFASIIELFTDALANYLSTNLIYGASRNIFIGFVLKSILTEAVGIQRRIAVYVLREYQIAIEESVKKEIEELIMKDKALQFFAHSELFSPVVPIIPYYNNFQIRNT